MVLSRGLSELQIGNIGDMGNTQVLVLAGGKAKRMGINMPKCMLEVAGKKLIDRCIECLTNDGFKDFVFLLGHGHEVVMDHVGDGRRYGIEPRYSIDPFNNIGWGKGKAIKYALECGKVDRNRRSIILFPDDLILDDHVYFKFLKSHLKAVQHNAALASMVLVRRTQYPYGVAAVKANGMIRKFTEKPFINKATSVGIYTFEPAVYDIIERMIDLNEPNAVELESTVIPFLAKQSKLFSFFISEEKWLPINTMKEYEHAVKVMSIQHFT